MTVGSKLIAFSMAGLSLASGCSWALVQPLPDDHANRTSLDCTTNLAPPIVDTLVTVAYAAAAVDFSQKSNLSHRGPLVGLAIADATIWAISAVYGYSNIIRCDTALEERAHGYDPSGAGWRAPPQFYPQPPVPPPPDGATSTAPSAPAPPSGR